MSAYPCPAPRPSSESSNRSRYPLTSVRIPRESRQRGGRAPASAHGGAVSLCENCGAELPAGARFCPQCAAPVPPGSSDEVEPEPPARPTFRVAERVLFAILLLAFAGFVVFVVLVVGFGFLVEGAAL